MSEWFQPPVTRTQDGAPRRVGVEIEFAGVALEGAIAIVVELFGGTPRRVNDFSYKIEGARYGTFVVEFDADVLSKAILREYLAEHGLGGMSDVFEDVLHTLSEPIVPYEIALPPIPLPEIEAADVLRERLRQAGARGTESAGRYAFALQLNVEAPALDAATTLAYVRAYSALQEWLQLECDVVFSRRLMAFAEPYDEDYVRHLLRPGYTPDAEHLIGDYLRFNPTRNRALDLFPLFGCLDADTRRFAALHEPAIVARPAYHYRLPNSLIGDPSWSIATEWRRWVEVERLAADPAALDALCVSYAAMVALEPTQDEDVTWRDRVAVWLGLSGR